MSKKRMGGNRFFDYHGPISLAKLAEQIGAELFGCDQGQADSIQIEDVKSLEEASDKDISFITNKRYIRFAKESKAKAIIIPEALKDKFEDQICLISQNPHHDYAKLLGLFYQTPSVQTAIHPSAIIDSKAQIGQNCIVKAGVVIAEGVSIGDHCIIEENTVIDHNVQIGSHCHIGKTVSLSCCEIGDHVKIASGARIGEAGFGFAVTDQGFVDIPQIAKVIIESRVSIGANTTIDRGSIHDTVIGAGTYIDNLVQIGHNVKIGQNCILCGQVGIAGSVQVGDQVIMGGQVGVRDNIKIGSNAKIIGQSGVMRDIKENSEMFGTPAEDKTEYFKNYFHLNKLLKKARHG